MDATLHDGHMVRNRPHSETSPRDYYCDFVLSSRCYTYCECNTVLGIYIALE